MPSWLWFRHFLLLTLAASPWATAEDAEEELFHFYDEFKHNCVRNCTLDPEPRECSYSFRLEWFMTMSKACFQCPSVLPDCYRPHCISADGVKRALLTVNRQLSGPGIHVCEGDTITVRLHNLMEMGEGTSIHWHGVHQAGTQHMDGVSMVSQCPVNSHSSFTYKFLATPAGTHFYHSHTGLQRSEGLFGPLVVRQAADPHAALYDTDLPEHTLLLTDWFHELGANKFASHHYTDGDNKPKGLLINGRGAFAPVSNGSCTPRFTLKVQPGLRHRVRVISHAILNCPFVLSVANHSLLIIASDGAPVEPLEVDSLIVYAGERFDFVLTANQRPGVYLLAVAGIADCDARFTSARQSALVVYTGQDGDRLQGQGNPPYADMLGPPGGRQLNPFNRRADDRHIDITSLRSLLDERADLGPPDIKFYIAFDFEVVNNTRYHHPAYYPISAVRREDGHLYTPQINNLALSMPPAPVLYQIDDVPQHLFCNNTEFNKSYESNFMSCVHVLRVDLNQIVEFVLIDKGVTFDASHPFHLHGHYFRVLGIDQLGASVSVDEVKALDAAGRLKRNLNRPAMKDTVIVPDGGYTIVRFRANNSGPWMLHCHLEFHVEIGMGLLVLVGDPADWASRVPENFPRCGHWDGPGPGPWRLRERRLNQMHQMRMLGLAAGAAVALLLAVLISVVCTKKMMTQQTVKVIEPIKCRAAYGSVKASQVTIG